MIVDAGEHHTAMRAPAALADRRELRRTNEALCALRAHIYLSLMGKQGLVELAQLCAARAAYARDQLAAIPGVKLKYAAPFFNEFAVELPRDASDVVSALIDKGVVPGFPVGRYYKDMPNTLLAAFTEKRTKEEIDVMAANIRAAL